MRGTGRIRLVKPCVMRTTCRAILLSLLLINRSLMGRPFRRGELWRWKGCKAQSPPALSSIQSSCPVCPRPATGDIRFTVSVEYRSRSPINPEGLRGIYGPTLKNYVIFSNQASASDWPPWIYDLLMPKLKTHDLLAFRQGSTKVYHRKM